MVAVKKLYNKSIMPELIKKERRKDKLVKRPHTRMQEYILLSQVKTMVVSEPSSITNKQ